MYICSTVPSFGEQKAQLPVVHGIWFLGLGNVNITTSAVKKFRYDINSTVDYVDPRAYYTFYGMAATVVTWIVPREIILLILP